MSRLPFLIIIILLLTIISCADHSNSQPPAEVTTPAQKDFSALHSSIDSLAKTVQGKIGVAMINLNTGDHFSFHGNDSFAMFSTYKFPLVLYVLHLVEEGKLSLDQPIKISKQSFKDYSHGEFIRTHKAADISMPVDSLIWYAMAYSDNITTDHLFHLVGGPEKVNEYIRNIGIEGMEIKSTVLQMGRGRLYKKNWCTPVAMTRLLQLMHDGKLVNGQHKAYLLDYMYKAPTGSKRIKGLLPEGTAVAHKTGTGGTNKGITEGVNDVGFVTLPNGELLALSVYINDIATDIAGGEAVIARIAKMVYEEASAGSEASGN